MNTAAKITLDGLVRALRWRSHNLAESVEGRYAGEDAVLARQGPASRDQVNRRAEGSDDDRAGH